jgi:hypothetical protein
MTIPLVHSPPTRSHARVGERRYPYYVTRKLLDPGTTPSCFRPVSARLRGAQDAYHKIRAGTARKKDRKTWPSGEDDLVQIKHKIAHLRKSRELTQAALAKRSDVSESRVESGKLNNLTLKHLQERCGRLARASIHAGNSDYPTS